MSFLWWCRTACLSAVRNQDEDGRGGGRSACPSRYAHSACGRKNANAAGRAFFPALRRSTMLSRQTEPVCAWGLPALGREM